MKYVIKEERKKVETEQTIELEFAEYPRTGDVLIKAKNLTTGECEAVAGFYACDTARVWPNECKRVGLRPWESKPDILIEALELIASEGVDAKKKQMDWINDHSYSGACIVYGKPESLRADIAERALGIWKTQE